MNILVGLFLLISSIYCFCTFDNIKDTSENAFHTEKLVYSIFGIVLALFLLTGHNF